MPQAEAVNRRQAEPDDEKRDSLPGRDQSHGDEVQPDEERPGDVHPVRANEVAGPVPPAPGPAPRTPGGPPPHPVLIRDLHLSPPPPRPRPKPSPSGGFVRSPPRPTAPHIHKDGVGR